MCTLYMGYNIEVSINIIKNSSVSEMENEVIDHAEKYGGIYYYKDYEFDNNIYIKRNHSIITINFDSSVNISFFIQFLKYIKNKNGIFIEVIYEEPSSEILYASKYYVTYMMEKHLAKKYKLNKRKRAYSEEDTLILNELDKK